MTAYELGDRVVFTQTLRRLYRPAVANSTRSRRIWEASRVWLWELSKVNPGGLEGVIVGARTLSDGECDDGFYDDPTVYYPTRTFPAYVVAWKLRRAHVLVLPEHLEPAPPQAVQEVVEDEPDTPLEGVAGECGATAPLVIGRCGRDAGHDGPHRSVGESWSASWAAS